MIYVMVHRNKRALSRTMACCQKCARPKNYTVAVCDRCKTPCAESRQPNSRGMQASNAAISCALELGWIQVPVQEKRVVTLQLICPTCQKG